MRAPCRFNSAQTSKILLRLPWSWGWLGVGATTRMSRPSHERGAARGSAKLDPLETGEDQFRHVVDRLVLPKKQVGVVGFVDEAADRAFQRRQRIEIFD